MEIIIKVIITPNPKYRTLIEIQFRLTTGKDILGIFTEKGGNPGNLIERIKLLNFWTTAAKINLMRVVENMNIF